MNLLILALILFQATVMTPERQAAMKASAQQISTYDSRIKQNNIQIAGLLQSNASIVKEKANFILQEKKRLGLDQTWSSDDQTRDWVQKK